MSDDKGKMPPGGEAAGKVQVNDIYRFVSTKINEALLEVESLVILGQLIHNDVDYFVDSEVVDELEGTLNRVDRNRLKYEHGISSDVDNVFFLEQHPFFFPTKDEQDDD
tara:strand:+ start:465 stop:791 length:327 start_codon:yes stop_codon:yes gene_type:complete